VHHDLRLSAETAEGQRQPTGKDSLTRAVLCCCPHDFTKRARLVKCRNRSELKGTTMRKVLFGIHLAVLLAFVATAHARNYSGWRWIRPFEPVWQKQGASDGLYLTGNNGAHAVAMHEYNSGDHRLMVAAALLDWPTSWVQVYEYEDIWAEAGQTAYPRRDGYSSRSPCIAAGPYYKQVAACQTVSPWKVWCAANGLDDLNNDWQYFNYLTPDGKYADPPEVAIDGQYYSGYDWVCVAHRAEDDENGSWLYCSRSTDGGYSFYDMTTIESSGYPVCPSLGVNGSGTVYCAFQDQDDDYDDVWFKKSTNNGGNWSNGVNLTPGDDQEGWSPCLAASGSMVFVCWNDDVSSPPPARVKYRWSSDGGSTWNPNPATNPPEEIEDWSALLHTNLNVVMIPGGTWGLSKPFWHVLLVAKGGDYVNSNIASFTVLKRGVLTTSGIEIWDRDLGMSPVCFFGTFSEGFRGHNT
jgi:hypothetical protein